MGLARYRRSVTSGEADTVYLGAYRTSQLRDAGAWRSAFAVNEDFDLNRRLRLFGRVWFDASLTVDYVARSSLLGLIRQYWAFGTGKARYWRLSGDCPRPRQFVLLVTPAAILAVLAGTGATHGPESAALLVAVLAGAAASVELLGAEGPTGGLRAHIAAVAVLGCVAASWLAGVVAGTVRPGSPADVADAVGVSR